MNSEDPDELAKLQSDQGHYYTLIDSKTSIA